MKQLIKYLSLLLFVLFVSHRAYPYDFEIGGIYYGYNANNQTVYVTKDYTKEQSYVGSVIIPQTVTYNGRTLDVAEIGENAFSNCKDLYNVSLPNSIKTIGPSAFKGCEGIVSISLPSSIKSMGYAAFSGCTGMKTIELPNTIEKIEGELFSDCSSLEKISIPNGIKDIGAYAFHNCISLKSVRIPSSVTAIRRHAFSGCSGIKTLVLEDGEKDLWIEEIVSGGSFYTPFDGANIKHIYIGRAYKQNSGYPADYSASYPIGFAQTKVLSLGESIKMINIWSQSIDTIYSFSTNPDKITVEFINSIYINAKLYVPTGTKEKYMAAEGWKNFFNIQEMDVADMWDGKSEPPTNDDTKEKCEKPTIHYSNGKLLFESATESAVCQSTITDSDITSYSGNEVQLGVTYNISVYATAAGYENSDVATATLCWIDVEPKTEGIENSVSQVSARAVLIQANNGILSISGVENGTDIAVYSSSGMMVGSAKSIGGSSSFATSLRNGEIAIVKIGDKAVKVVMK